MITIRVHLISQPEKQLELMQAIGGLKHEITLETGCVSCRVYQNIENRNEFVVLEEWENEKSARAHLESDNLAVLVGAGSVLAQDVCVSLANDPATRTLAGSYVERIVEKKKIDHGVFL